MEAVERNFERRNVKIDLYQIGTDAAEGEVDEFGGKFAADRVTS